MDITQRFRLLGKPIERNTVEGEPYLSLKVSGLGFVQCFNPDYFDQLEEAWKEKMTIECVLSVEDKTGPRRIPYYKLLEIVSASLPTGGPEDAPTSGEAAPPADDAGPGPAAPEVSDEDIGQFRGMAIDEEDR